MPSLPSEDEVWEWLRKLNLTGDETHKLNYFEREIIEKKVYVCMKEESGADHSPIGEPLSLALENVAILWWATPPEN